MKRRHKRGSMLIETIISLSILLLAGTLSVNLVKSLQNSFNIREERERANRAAYAIESEMKYNYKVEEIVNEFKNKGSLKYEFSKENFKKLLREPLFNLEGGEGIEIELNSTNEDKTILLIKITIKNNKGDILSEREFTKTNWI
ncbi:MAG: type II secretion system protein [Clostridiales bacterium]|nr:type II secretion system protein [Clostridiales bacterium]